MELLSKDPLVKETSDGSGITVTPSEDTGQVVVDTDRSHFSDLTGRKIRFVDIYQDARTLMQKTNSTKFIVISYSLLALTSLLMMGFISPAVFKDMFIMLALSYMGVDAFEKQALMRKRK